MCDCFATSGDCEVFELAGAGLASAAFMVTRDEEFSKEGHRSERRDGACGSRRTRCERSSVFRAL